MQFGIFSVSDITRNPVTGYTPSEAERIEAIVQIARRADEVGLDVFAIGEHHNPPFFSSSPTTLLAHIAALTERIILSTAVTLITTNDPVKIAEDYAMLQHLAGGRVDLMLGRGNTVPVYPWFGQDIRQGLPLALEHYNLLHRLWREDVVDWEGKLPDAAAGLHVDPAAARRRAAVRLARRDPHAGDRRAGRLLRQRLLRQQHPGAELPLRAAGEAVPGAVRALRARHAGAGDRRPRRPRVHRQALAGRDPNAYRPYFEGSPIYGHSYKLEDYMDGTPMSVGSPQEVIEKTLTFQEGFGDYQRQLWNVDAVGLPLEMVLEQVELLGTEVVPVLRERWRRAARPGCPTHRPTPASSEAKYGDGERARLGPTRTAATTSPARPLPGHGARRRDGDPEHDEARERDLGGALPRAVDDRPGAGRQGRLGGSGATRVRRALRAVVGARTGCGSPSSARTCCSPSRGCHASSRGSRRAGSCERVADPEDARACRIRLTAGRRRQHSDASGGHTRGTWRRR